MLVYIHQHRIHLEIERERRERNERGRRLVISRMRVEFVFVVESTINWKWSTEAHKRADQINK